MLKELFTASLGMMNQQTKLEVTANNLANASTVGFKRAAAFERNLIDARANFYNTKGDAEQNDPPIGSYYDFSAGAYQQTDNPLDIAIEGEGFFVLKDAEGKDFLTRGGSFKLSEEGYIISQDGKMLIGANGPIKLDSEIFSRDNARRDGSSLNLRIAPTGELFSNDNEIDRIALAKVSDPTTLQRISNSSFIGTWLSDVEIMPNEEITVRQGWLEGSNVNIVAEMVQMIELQRMFEAGSKVIQTNDGTLDRSIALGRYY
jgi:flagellar basal body rod protein FlgG